nr:hypothetical protein [Synechococcus sp. CS-1333]
MQAAVDQVIAGTTNLLVGTAAAPEQINAGIAVEAIGTGATIDDVVAITTENDVVSAKGTDRIIAIQAFHGVAGSGAREHVIAGCSGELWQWRRDRTSGGEIATRVVEGNEAGCCERLISHQNFLKLQAGIGATHTNSRRFGNIEKVGTVLRLIWIHIQCIRT